MQGTEQVIPVTGNTAVIVLLGIFISEKVISMVIKGVKALRNGNGKREKDVQVTPCLQQPQFTNSWERHKQETHDTKLGVDRVEGSMKSLCDQSIIRTTQSRLQTDEMKKQTKLLEKIQKNGS